MADLEIFRKTLGGMGTNCYIMVNHDTCECIVFDPARRGRCVERDF